MRRNERFLIATACLHLAAKVEECPKHITHIIRHCLMQRHRSSRTEYKRIAEDTTARLCEPLKDEVLQVRGC